MSRLRSVLIVRVTTSNTVRCPIALISQDNMQLKHYFIDPFAGPLFKLPREA